MRLRASGDGPFWDGPTPNVGSAVRRRMSARGRPLSETAPPARPRRRGRFVGGRPRFPALRGWSDVVRQHRRRTSLPRPAALPSPFRNRLPGRGAPRDGTKLNRGAAAQKQPRSPTMSHRSSFRAALAPGAGGSLRCSRRAVRRGRGHGRPATAASATRTAATSSAKSFMRNEAAAPGRNQSAAEAPAAAVSSRRRRRQPYHGRRRSPAAAAAPCGKNCARIWWYSL